MNSLTLCYSGKVDISFTPHRGCVTYHNEGLPYLMRLFAKAVTGNALTSSDLPVYLDLRKKKVVDDSEIWTSVLRQNVPLSGKTFQYATDQIVPNWTANFTASLTHSSLQDTITEADSGQYRLYLMSAYDEDSLLNRYHDFAQVDVEVKDLAKITPGTQAIVEWTLQVKNAE